MLPECPSWLGKHTTKTNAGNGLIRGACVCGWKTKLSRETSLIFRMRNKKTELMDIQDMY